LSTTEEGEVNGTEVSLESKNVGRMSFARDPAVTKVMRSIIFRVDIIFTKYNIISSDDKNLQDEW
jgi:hypothetical protein